VHDIMVQTFVAGGYCKKRQAGLVCLGGRWASPFGRMDYTGASENGKRPEKTNRSSGLFCQVTEGYTETPLQEFGVAIGLVRFMQPTDGHGTVLGATLDQLVDPILQPCDTGTVVGLFLLGIPLEDLAQPIPLLLLLRIGGIGPTGPEPHFGAEAIGVLVEVGDEVIAEGKLCFHALHYDRTGENGKRWTIGNSNRRRRTDSRGSNAQVWIRAPVLRLL
jgi:hypothetical protein